MSNLELFVDSNERGLLLDAITRRCEKEKVNIVKKRLVVGDYSTRNSIIEAKSVSDLRQSAHSGHLWRQLENLDANEARPIFLIHGTVQAYVKLAKAHNPTVSYPKIAAELTGLMARMIADFDVSILSFPNQSEAAQFIVRLIKKENTSASRHGVKAVRRSVSNDIRKDLLLSIPGIGPQLADRLLEEVGCIEEMCFPESLGPVKGISKRLADRIVGVLTSEEPIEWKENQKKLLV